MAMGGWLEKLAELGAQQHMLQVQKQRQADAELNKQLRAKEQSLPPESRIIPRGGFAGYPMVEPAPNLGMFEQTLPRYSEGNFAHVIPQPEYDQMQKERHQAWEDAKQNFKNMDAAQEILGVAGGLVRPPNRLLLQDENLPNIPPQAKFDRNFNQNTPKPARFIPEQIKQGLEFSRTPEYKKMIAEEEANLRNKETMRLATEKEIKKYKEQEKQRAETEKRVRQEQSKMEEIKRDRSDPKKRAEVSNTIREADKQTSKAALERFKQKNPDSSPDRKKRNTPADPFDQVPYKETPGIPLHQKVDEYKSKTDPWHKRREQIKEKLSRPVVNYDRKTTDNYPHSGLPTGFKFKKSTQIQSAKTLEEEKIRDPRNTNLNSGVGRLELTDQSKRDKDHLRIKREENAASRKITKEKPQEFKDMSREDFRRSQFRMAKPTVPEPVAKRLEQKNIRKKGSSR
jgi:hypothetical protein